MAEISKLSRLVAGVQRQVDLSSNTLVVDAVKIGTSGTLFDEALAVKLAAIAGATGAQSITTTASTANHTPSGTSVEDYLNSIDTQLAAAGGTEFADDVFRVVGSADSSKKLAFEVDGITGSNTRTITMPDADVDLGALANTTLSNLGVTAINTSLISDGALVDDLGSDAKPWNYLYTQGTSFYSAASTSVGEIGNSGGVLTMMGVDSGTNIATLNKASNVSSGAIAIYTGSCIAASNSIVTGAASLKSGPNSGATSTGGTGTVSVESGAITASSGASGAVNVSSGNNAGTGDSGAVTVASGTSTGGTRGTVTIGAAIDGALLESQPTGGTDLAIATTKYVDDQVASAIAGGATFQGDYDAATNTPDLDTTPIAGITQGDMYVATTAGTFFAGTVLEVGDILISKQDTPTLETHWTVVQANLTAETIKTQYESNADRNAYTDAEKIQAALQTGTNTGDEVAATDELAGIVELATIAEIDLGTDTERAITPAGLAGSALATSVSGKWDVAGNALTADAVLGSTTDFDVSIQRNSLEFMKLTDTAGYNELLIPTYIRPQSVPGFGGPAWIAAKGLAGTSKFIIESDQDDQVGDTADMQVRSGGIYTGSALTSGSLLLQSGDISTALGSPDGTTGGVDLRSGNIQSGANAGAAGNTGGVVITSGAINEATATGNTGDVAINVGANAGSGTRGSISLNAPADQSTLGIAPTGGTSLAIATTGYVDAAVGNPSSLTKSFVAGVAMAVDTTFLVRMAVSGETAGRIYKADNAAGTEIAPIDNYYVIGVVQSGVAVSIGDSVEVTLMGESAHGASDTPFGAGDIGKPVYLGAAGAFTVTAPTATNTAIVRVGVVQETGKILVQGIQLNGIN
jgi:hypothetical protein